MPRLHLLEIHDQAWCPASLRDALTDNLQLYLDLGNLYAAAAPRLRAAVAASGARRIVDLCSGAGGPWRRLHRAVDTAGVEILLTDKYPNVPALERTRAATGGGVRFSREAVDVMRVPATLEGFRTLFTAFHHFRPAEARAILKDAVDRGQGIGVFEVSARQAFAIVTILFAPLFVLVAAPFIRPFRWSRLAWTFSLVLPLVALIDGVVSCLRTYDPAELRALTAPLAADGYTWEIGEERAGLLPIPLTYLIGIPNAKGASHSPAPQPPSPLAV